MKSFPRSLFHLGFGLLALWLSGRVSAQSHSARSATFALDLLGPPVFTSAALSPTRPSGTAYAATLTASGNPAPTFSVQAGALPGGLTLSGSTGGLSGIPTTPGTFTGVFAATNSQGTATQAFSFTVVTLPMVPFTGWAAAAGLSGADAEATATPHNDGVANLLKYAFNMNGAGADASVLVPGGMAGLPLIAASTNVGGQSLLAMTYLKRRGGVLVYEAQESTDLVSFGPLLGTTSTTAIDANWERVTIEAAISAAPRRFFRVAVALPPVPAGFVLISAGVFQMGDNFADGWSEEQPAHSVTLSEYYMATKETTKAKWDEVQAWGLANGYTDLYAGSGKAADHPVQEVSWDDIVKWCNAASEREGLVPVYRTSTGAVHRTGTTAPVINYTNNGYRLPSEAEWEKAARGGLSGKRFPWGDTIDHSQANYYSTPSYVYNVNPELGYHPNYQSGGVPFTSPVGSFAANGFGLYDMAGNVWEWCNDWHGSGYYASSPNSDPRGPTSGTYRAVRGSGWDGGDFFCRVASRNNNTPSSRGNSIGFRLARSL